MLRAQRWTWPQIAEEVGLSTRACEKVWSLHLKGRTEALIGQGPDEIVAEAIEELEAISSQAAEIADTTEYDAVKVGALKTQADLVMKRIALQQSTGLLPHDLGTIRHLIDLRERVVLIAAVLRKHKVPVVVQEEIAAVVGGGAD